MLQTEKASAEENVRGGIPTAHVAVLCFREGNVRTPN